MEHLLSRVRGEFREMPGLRLTLAQACRLWHLDQSTCVTLLEQLAAERTVRRLDDGSYIGLPGAPAQPAKASLHPAPAPGSRVRRA